MGRCPCRRVDTGVYAGDWDEAPTADTITVDNPAADENTAVDTQTSTAAHVGVDNQAATDIPTEIVDLGLMDETRDPEVVEIPNEENQIAGVQW